MKDKMPTKSPELWFQIWNSLPEPIKAAILATLLSIAMAFRDDSRTWRVMLADAVICATITLIVGSVCELSGVSTSWSYIAGSAVGGIGVAPVRTIAIGAAQKLVDKWLSR